MPAVVNKLEYLVIAAACCWLTWAFVSCAVEFLDRAVPCIIALAVIGFANRHGVVATTAKRAASRLSA